MPCSPRQIALDVLNTLEKSPFHLDRIIEDMIDDNELSSHRDRNLVNAIVYGVLRWRKLLDWIISQHSSISIEKIHPDILNILRIGLFQIFFFDRIPVSAAVNTSVDMAKKKFPSWTAGYVNAVLRNASKNKTALPYPNLDQDPVNSISIIKSFPKWLVERWVNHYGVDETLRLCDAYNEIPSLTCRTNTLRADRGELLTQLADEADKISLTDYSPDGILLNNLKTAIHKMKTFDSGYFQVQDEAAQLISYLLSPRSGEIILDACAGLGGKTGHIAQLMKNKGQLIAIDKDPQKISRLNNEMKRLGVSVVSALVSDLEKPIPNAEVGRFDRILLDAPCSGLGVIRRNPDVKWDTSRQNLKRYQVIQKKFLDRVSHMVKPGGIIVYAVCSIEPEENEIVVTEFLKDNLNFEIFTNFDQLPFDSVSFFAKDKFFRSLSHIHPMDGFFAACLKKMQ